MCGDPKTQFDSPHHVRANVGHRQFEIGQSVNQTDKKVFLWSFFIWGPSIAHLILLETFFRLWENSFKERSCFACQEITGEHQPSFSHYRVAQQQEQQQQQQQQKHQWQSRVERRQYPGYPECRSCQNLNFHPLQSSCLRHQTLRSTGPSW